MKIEEKNNKKKEFLKFICFQIKKERKKKGREFIRINFFFNYQNHIRNSCESVDVEVCVRACETHSSYYLLVNICLLKLTIDLVFFLYFYV